MGLLGQAGDRAQRPLHICLASGCSPRPLCLLSTLRLVLVAGRHQVVEYQLGSDLASRRLSPETPGQRRTCRHLSGGPWGTE